MFFGNCSSLKLALHFLNPDTGLYGAVLSPQIYVPTLDLAIAGFPAQHAEGRWKS